mmetsp:Transcript_10795/g.14009  ORF Transcript_10795/g.14009 Transcript_10795/m.14009 type:complete len:220 (-) Transcript_10795:601-1260(-)|eukprot:CAMPEP_0117758350 /NCGR_PEP_ID=MMETSP0947-20121206/15322_1 /TAXON_ID=44440 /ORGANISM="Chattonella subsalsa, Strain CCMP2191" /LENGTH=219 /DNA_ID=CAMNT_0005578513 /DNA_START=52 /DNA_END=711 /DNA_ORIENTATION=-
MEGILRPFCSLQLARVLNPVAVNSCQFRLFSQLPPRHATTILCVRKNNKVVMIGDGQVSMGPMVVKDDVKKVRRIGEDIIAGFAGSTADAFTLMDRLEEKLEQHPGQLTRASVELAKAWRTDKYLRHLEATLLVADKETTFEITGVGDVLQPTYGVMGVGSGGAYAWSAAKALVLNTDMDAEDIAKSAMDIASDMCVYTNKNWTIEVIETDEDSVEGER